MMLQRSGDERAVMYFHHFQRKGWLWASFMTNGHSFYGKAHVKPQMTDLETQSWNLARI